MLDVKYIKNNLSKRGFEFDVNKFMFFENERTQLQTKIQTLQNKRNVTSKLIGQLKNIGENVEIYLNEMSSCSNQIKKLNQQLNKIEEEFEKFLLEMPNLLDDDVPEQNNIVVYEWGNKNFEILDYIKRLDQIDFAIDNMITKLKHVETILKKRELI